MRLFKGILSSTVMFFSLSALAANAPPVKATLVAEEASVAADRAFWIGVKFDIPKEWHMYWQNPGDSGQAPQIKWEVPSSFTVGGIQWPRPDRIPVGPLMNYGYSDSLLLMARVEPPPKLVAGASVSIAAKVKWLACRDICIPGQADLSLALPVSSASPSKSSEAPFFQRVRERLIHPSESGWKASAESKGNIFVLELDAGRALGGAVSFLPRQRYQIDNAAPQRLTREGNRLRLELKKSEALEELPKALDGVLVVDNTGYAVTAALGEGAAGLASVLEALLLAFLGGFILNLMPCVFPVLSIKAISLLGQAGQEKRVVRRHGILYSAGVLVSFWIMAGLLIALRAGGEKLGWGFQLQSPVFDSALAVLLFGMSLNLLGIFELGSSFVGVGSGLASQRGYAGSFFTGALATVVATPCTAPFMGTALGFAASQPAAIAFLVFTALAAGLAAPYLALSFTPALGRFIPRPGRWMESMKQFMAFPLLGTVIWLLWIVGLQAGPLQVTKLLLALLLLGLAGWTLGRWKNTTAYAAIAGLSGVALWVGVAGAAGTATNATEALKWEPYSKARVAELRESGKPVFIDFTAAWCVTCKVNETVALSSPSIANRVRELGIVTLKGDWTNSDAEITRALGELGRDGVPLYVLYTRKKDNPPRILPQILTAQIVLDELNAID